MWMIDILLTENDLTKIQRVKDCLLQQFRIKDLGDLKYFLGIGFSRSKAGIYISQRKYALNILQDTGLRCSSRQISNGTIPKTHIRR